MATMKDLVERECGGSNPLLQMASHFTRDTDLHSKFASEFLSGHQQGAMAPTTFQMDGLLREMQDIERSSQLPQPGPDVIDLAARNWSEEFLNPSNRTSHSPLIIPRLNEQDDWAGEFFGGSAHPSASNVDSDLSAVNNLWAHEYLELQDDITVGPNMDEFSKIFDDVQRASDNQKTPGAEIAKDCLADVAQELLHGVDTSDPKLANSEFMKFIKQISEGTVNLAGETESSPWKLPEGTSKSDRWATEFSAPSMSRADIWSDEFSAANLFESDDEAAKQKRIKDFYAQYPLGVKSDAWIYEYNQSASPNELTDWYNDVPHDATAEKWVDEFTSESSNTDFWKNLQKQWEQLAEEDVDGVHSWLSDYGGLDADSFYKDYKFSEENHLKDVPQPFDEGLQRLSEGDIPSAVLLFEAAVQNDPHSAKAWQYLGTTQASNEQDRLAIAALRKCVELDEGNLVALLSLAVSYTNESMHQQACDSLLSWLRHNPFYSSHLGPIPSHDVATKPPQLNISSFVSSERYNEVVELLIKAVQIQPDRIDPDLQVGLGVLFNLAGDYDKAVDCFHAALQIRPDDSLIWNKLGASLANGQHCEEAVNAYRRALDLSPGYIRTRYNLGLSCINLGAYREGMEHFLTALTLQNTSLVRASTSQASETNSGICNNESNVQSAISNNIWASVQMTLKLLNRDDFLAAGEARRLDELNREFNSNV